MAPLDDAPASLADSLSPAERARAARFKFPDDARRWTAARGWLRHVLGEALGVAPAAVPIPTGPGKPRVEGVCFNLAHAGELAVIAVADHEVGIDIEPLDAGPAALEAASVACTPEESAFLARLPPEEAAPVFLSWWTAKEAYLKATGEGLAFPPDRVGVLGVERGETVAVRITGDPPPPQWCVRPIRPAPNYVGAVAVPRTVLVSDSHRNGGYRLRERWVGARPT